MYKETSINLIAYNPPKFKSTQLKKSRSLQRVSIGGRIVAKYWLYMMLI
jgi:hypothetical protein